MAENKNIGGEVGSTYNYEKVSPRVLKSQQDSFEQIINRSGRFQLFEDMVLNEPIIGAFNNLVESFVCSEKFYMKPSDLSDEAKMHAELINGMIFDDLEVPFSQSLRDWLTMCQYGFSVSEILFKKSLVVAVHGYNKVTFRD